MNAENWASSSGGAYAIYPCQEVEGINSDNEMVNAYGLLYNWQAARDPRGLCPEGWRIPECGEWSDLSDFVDDKMRAGFEGVGDALKAARQVGHPWGGTHDTNVHPRWNENMDYFGRDEFGFTAYAGGFRTHDGAYQDLGYVAAWWSSSQQSATDVWVRYIWSWENFMIRRHANSHDGLSVRCIRDAK